MHRKALLLVMGCAVTLAGCGNNDVILKKQMEMEARLEQLVQGSAAANSRLNELTGEVKSLEGKVASQATELDELKTAGRDLRDLKSSVETLSQRVNEPPPASPKIEVVNPEPGQPDKDAGPQAAYMKAFGLFSANKYPEAIVAFEAFLKSYPAHEYAANAQYWIGECLYTQHEYPKALEAFKKVVSAYPKSGKVPDAMLKVGFSQISLNERTAAVATLRELIEKYPRSQAAVKAKERLNRH